MNRLNVILKRTGAADDTVRVDVYLNPNGDTAFHVGILNLSGAEWDMLTDSHTTFTVVP